jgi:hypothetical protein
MKRMLTVLAVLVVAAAGAQDGWINLFDGETVFGWTSAGDAQWQVQDGALACESGSGGWIYTTTEFANFELEAEIQVVSGAEEPPEFSTGLVFRAPADGHPSENGSGMLVIAEPKGSKGSGWKKIHVTADGAAINATVDGAAVETNCTRALGHVGILYHHNGKAKVSVRNVRLKPLGLAPVFNGKDLSGWNIIPDRKSEFKVVDGGINITNGNGQIETDQLFKDFALQLDIFSNGDHLNSGVFFRGPKGVFWKGYEAQVRNQWEGDDRTKPVDFGTGGNYGNQPARKVVPSDREWFQMTVICHDNHAATWVNGYQVSDFTDTRAISPDDNGKAGYVPGPGTIHLQGHDPTTDLTFKNIVIQEYPEG